MSDRHLMISPTPPAAYASNTISSSAAPPSSPVPFLMARSMLSAGMFTALHFPRIVRSVMLAAGSPPPLRAEIVSSLASLLKIFPRLASVAAFLCLIVAHLL